MRFAGEAGGLWAEGVRNLTGLRRDPGAAVREAQLAGRATPPLAQWGKQVRELHHRIPAWGDYSLSQLSADGFQIRKRTTPGHELCSIHYFSGGHFFLHKEAKRLVELINRTLTY